MNKKLVTAIAIVAAFAVVAVLFAIMRANFAFREVVLDSQVEVLKQLEKRITIDVNTRSSEGMLGLIGLVLVVEGSNPEGKLRFDRTSVLPQFRPARAEISVRPLNNDIIYQGCVSSELSSGGAYAAVNSELSSKQTAELVVKDEVFIGYRDLTSLPLDKLRAYVREKREEGKSYYFVEDATITSVVYRTFSEAGGEASGTAFKANGRIYASNTGYANQVVVSVTAWNLDGLEEGEAGGSDSAAFQQLLMKKVKGELTQEDARAASTWLRKFTEGDGQPPVGAEIDLSDIEAASDSITPDDLGLDESALRFNYRISGLFTRLKQESSRTCWAAAATMLGAWKQGRQMSTDGFLLGVGARYADMARQDKPLKRVSKEAFLETAGFSFDWGQSYHPDGFEQLLRRSGPIWITTTQDGEFSKHARVVVAMYGEQDIDRTFVIFVDPEDGAEHALSYSEFMRSYEDVAYTQNALNDQLEGFQVVYCAQ